MARRDPNKTARNRIIAAIQVELRELLDEVLEDTGYNSEASLNATIGSKHDWFFDLKHDVIPNHEAFVQTWFQGFKERANNSISSCSQMFNCLTVANVTALLTAAWNASTIPEFAEITATDSTTHVTLTMDTAGKPFIQTSSAAGGTATLVTATTTAATGPNHWDAAANWSTGAVPVNSDVVYFDNSDVPVLYGLAQSGVTLAGLFIASSYTGDIGLPEFNTDATSYREYRDQYLIIGATTWVAGYGPGNGSGRIKLNNGTIQTAARVLSTGSPAEQDMPALIWKGTHPSNVIEVDRGSFGAAVFGDELATIATLNMAFETGLASDADVFLGPGVTITTVSKGGGFLTVNGAIGGAITNDGGDMLINGTGAVTGPLVASAGTIVYSTNGTLGGNTVLSGSAVLDLSRDKRATTITNPVEVHGDTAVFLDRHKRTGAVVLDLNFNGSIGNHQLGSNIRITRGTPA